MTRPGALVRGRAGAPTATFPGFRLLEGGRSQIYVELSRVAPVEQKRDRGTLVYVLRGAQVVSRNNKNPLITTHFATPVDRARLVSVGRDLELVVDLRTDVTPALELVTLEDGAARLELTFPAGDFASAVASKRFERMPASPVPNETDEAADQDATAAPAALPATARSQGLRDPRALSRYRSIPAKLPARRAGGAAAGATPRELQAPSDLPAEGSPSSSGERSAGSAPHP